MRFLNYYFFVCCLWVLKLLMAYNINTVLSRSCVCSISNIYNHPYYFILQIIISFANVPGFLLHFPKHQLCFCCHQHWTYKLFNP